MPYIETIASFLLPGIPFGPLRDFLAKFINKPKTLGVLSLEITGYHSFKVLSVDFRKVRSEVKTVKFSQVIDASLDQRV